MNISDTDGDVKENFYLHPIAYNTEGKEIVEPVCKICGSSKFCVIGESYLLWLCPAECQERSYEE